MERGSIETCPHRLGQRRARIQPEEMHEPFTNIDQSDDRRHRRSRVARDHDVVPGMSASAQDVARSSGTSSETLASVLVDGGSRLVLMRFTLKPDATIEAHSHSGPAVFTVISGELQTELIRGGATVSLGMESRNRQKSER